MLRKIAYFVIYGTCKDSIYNSVAIFGTAPIFLQSINQNLAETVVVNDTLSFMKVNGVEPVTSSHWDSLVPPKVNKVLLIQQHYKNRKEKKYLFYKI